MSLQDAVDQIEELRKYSDTAFAVEEAYQLTAALHILHRLRNSRPASVTEDMLKQRQALFDIVIRILKSELIRAARDLNNRLTAWERMQKQ